MMYTSDLKNPEQLYVFLSAWRTQLYASSGELSEELNELLEDLTTALSRLLKNISKWDSKLSEKIARLIMQILTLPGIALPFKGGNGLPSFMLNVFLNFFPKSEAERNHIVWEIFYGYFTAPFRESESLADYRTRVFLAAILNQHFIRKPHDTERAEWILFNIYAYLEKGGPIEVTPEFRASLRKLTQGENSEYFRSNVVEEVQILRDKYPATHFIVLSTMGVFQGILREDQKEIPVP